MNDKIENLQNIQIITKELEWLHSVIENGIDFFLEGNQSDYQIPPPAELSYANTHYTNFIKEHAFIIEEKIICLLALAPEIKPEILEAIKIYNSKKGKGYPELGGIYLPHTNAFIPTIKTALTFLGGPNLEDQLKYFNLFEKNSKFYQNDILRKFTLENDQPGVTGKLILSEKTLSYLLKGEDVQYEYSHNFPASKLTTQLEWDDLILNTSTNEGLNELTAWLK